MHGYDSFVASGVREGVRLGYLGLGPLFKLIYTFKMTEWLRPYCIGFTESERFEGA